MKKGWITVVALSLVLCGCGGGGGNSVSAPEELAGQPFEFGNLSGRAASTNPPLTTNSSSVAATALTGLITTLRLRDQQVTTDELRVLFRSNMLSQSGNGDLYSVNLDGSDLVRITETSGINEFSPQPSPDSKRIAFAAVGTGGDYEIFVMNMDGSGRVQLTNNTANDFYPRWAPSGNNLVFWDNNDDIYVVNVNTKAITPIVVDGFKNQHPTYTADGSAIVFSSFARIDSDRYHLHSTPSTGGGPITVHTNFNGAESRPTFSPDGVFMAFYDFLGPNRFYRLLNGNRLSFAPGESHVEWAPDSRRTVFTRDVLTRERIFTSVLDGPATEVLPDLVGVNMSDPSFIPPPKDVVFVGPGSLFGSRLAGFIFSQTGPSVRSLLGFDAATPSSVVMTKQTPSDTSSPNLIYSVDADVVTEISYAHAPYWKPLKVVGGGTTVSSAHGALVSIDSNTGKIVAVLPFTGLRSGKPKTTEEAGRVTFVGNFLGVFDAYGKNVAQEGASEVVLDTRTGELTARS